MSHATAAHCHRLSRQFPLRSRWVRARACARAPAYCNGDCRDSARQCAAVIPTCNRYLVRPLSKHARGNSGAIRLTYFQIVRTTHGGGNA